MTNQDYFKGEASVNRDRWLYADSSNKDGSDEQAHSSAPYIIQLSSAGDAVTINNVVIGNSYTNRTATNFGQDLELSITSTVTGVSYLEFLAQSEQQPFVVGSTMVICSNSQQLDMPYTIIHKNANGDRQDRVISTTLDPYQQQTDRLVDFSEYIFDGMTSIAIGTFIPGATLTIRLYPKKKFAASQIVSDRPGIQTYANSDIIKAIPFR